ncbi:MAG: hypothetical protein M1820_009488 [Bogoriella megaspora]|nr:MAG: hypothetical protein M1820_009488 [Bogoriella megaspora]
MPRSGWRSGKCLASSFENPAQFYGRIILECYEDALETARRACSVHDPSHHILWTDATGPKPEKSLTGAAALCQPTVLDPTEDRPARCDWKQVTLVTNIACNHTAELIAIWAALRLAAQEEKWEGRITIFSDSAFVLKRIAGILTKAPVWYHTPESKEIVMWIYDLSKLLHQRGLSLALRLVPGHSGIKPNKRADRIAKRSRLAAEKWDIEFSGKIVLHFLKASQLSRKTRGKEELAKQLMRRDKRGRTTAKTTHVCFRSSTERNGRDGRSEVKKVLAENENTEGSSEEKDNEEDEDEEEEEDEEDEK